MRSTCALFWRKTLSVTPTKVVTDSRRVCALLLEGSGIKLLYICVYLPYEKNADSVDEFIYQLSVIESVLNHGDSCHVIVAGDFNTDFNPQSVYCCSSGFLPKI